MILLEPLFSKAPLIENRSPLLSGICNAALNIRQFAIAAICRITNSAMLNGGITNAAERRHERGGHTFFYQYFIPKGMPSQQVELPPSSYTSYYLTRLTIAVCVGVAPTIVIYT